VEGFHISGNTLRVSVDLDLDSDEAFKAACDQLLTIAADTLYMDLTRVGFIGSSFFGQMFVVNYKAKKAGRKLVIRTPQRLMAIMELLGLPQLVEVQVVNEGAGEAPKEKAGA